jgi:adenylate cyclase
MWTYEDEANQTAMAMFKQSSEADPGFAPAHAYFAYSCYITVIMGYAEDPDARLQEGLAAGKMALKCDDKDAISHYAIARIQMMLGNHEDSIASLEKSIELNPCFAQSYHGLGFALTLAGELEEAKRVTRKAIEMSPRDPMLWAFLAVHSITLVLNGENEAAFETIKKTMRLPNATGYWNHAMMAATLGNLGRIEEARAALEIAKQENPGFSIEFVVNNMPTRFEGGLDPYLDGLRRAGLE